MQDRITLTGLRVHGRHGVFDGEREHGQEFVVDVALHLDLTPAAVSDDLVQTVDYGEVADRVVEVVAGPAFDLIEGVAGAIADVVLGSFRAVDSITVTVHKPEAPIGHTFTDVAVTITRGRSG